ncbi:ABC transporter ATP-binding protein [Paenibacillus woosongensis]|uniref:ATP-binding cassette domain-containing protein n=1 Tax=Paenibacillus woosongensis TaxID=307580 RepID=A0A7X2Z235_9BACL|nr:ABC transporter ATP-binding protein [Paenibacillus woosongensis]MUG45461.1 ATP-binding cassette domain-containing protein [Paenibacillus woosongensis]
MSKKEFQYRNLLFLWPYLKQSKYKFMTGMIGMGLSSLLITPIPYLIGYSIDNIILMNKGYLDLLKIALLMAIIYIAGYMVNIGYSYIFSKVQYEVVNKIRVSTVESVIDAPLAFHNKHDKGYTLGRISESSSLGVLFSPSFLGTVTGIFDFIFSLFVMFQLSSTLTFTTLIIIPLYFIISRQASRKISESTTRVYESSAQLNGEVFETLNGIEEIKLLVGKDTQIQKLNRKLESMIKSLLKQSLNFVFFVQNIILSNNLVTTFVLFISGILILNNDLTIGIYTSFSLYLSKLLATTQAFGSIEVTLKPVCVSISRIKGILETENENMAGARGFDESISTIRFKEVSFKYEAGKEWVIQNMDFELETGDRVLLRGLNGSGKTTLIKLITGLYKPVQGQIMMNEQDYSLLDINSIRKRIGIVSQSIFLFKGTVADNILFGQTGKTIDDVIATAQKYNLMGYLEKLPKGLNTEISQNGFGVSGGQTQVIAFLRAVLVHRDLIILDEATSNLDIDTKDLIAGILNAEQLCHILIVISHQAEQYDYINKVIDLDQYKDNLVLQGQ